jgi:hypothetical protein
VELWDIFLMLGHTVRPSFSLPLETLLHWHPPLDPANLWYPINYELSTIRCAVARDLPYSWAHGPPLLLSSSWDTDSLTPDLIDL